MKKECHIYFLELLQASDRTIKIDTKFKLKILKKPITTKRYIQLYEGVGKAYQWVDRLIISEEELEQTINKKETHIFVLRNGEQEIGFTELARKGDNVEILYFGLFQKEIGKGYGPQFFQLTLEKAWSMLPHKVYLNTCDLDHPKALQMYQRFGFKETKRIIKNY